MGLSQVIQIRYNVLLFHSQPTRATPIPPSNTALGRTPPKFPTRPILPLLPWQVKRKYPILSFLRNSAPSVSWIFELFGKSASLPFWVVFRVKPPFYHKKEVFIRKKDIKPSCTVGYCRITCREHSRKKQALLRYRLDKFL